MVAKLISPEGLIDLLRQGRPSDILADDPPAALGGLDADSLGNIWRIYLNSELGIGRFFLDVPVDKPPLERLRLQFCLREWTWKLCGIELPEPLQVRLAQELLKREAR